MVAHTYNPSHGRNHEMKGIAVQITWAKRTYVKINQRTPGFTHPWATLPLVLQDGSDEMHLRPGKESSTGRRFVCSFISETRCRRAPQAGLELMTHLVSLLSAGIRGRRTDR
jgi:hypothetical protein